MVGGNSCQELLSAASPTLRISKNQRVKGNEMPYFELIGDDPKLQSGHTAKYWEITLVGKKVIVRYGKIGTDGQLSPKEFESKEEAEAFVAKKIKEKTKEGYIEKPNPDA
jgi:predicted DNA-binding WGR domain protein